MSGKLSRAVRVLLTAVLALGLLVQSVPVQAVTQAEIDALEARRDELRERQENIQEQLDALRNERNTMLERKFGLDEQSELLRQDIELLNEEIALYDGVIAEKREETENARAMEEEQYARYLRRVRVMEESNGWTYIAFILGASSLTDLLSRLNDVLDIVSHDQDLKAEYTAAREAAEATEAELEATQARRRAKQEELTAREALLEEQIRDAGKLLAQLEEDVDLYAEFYEAAEAEKERVQAEIDEKAEELRKQQAAAAATAAQQTWSGGGTGGGTGSAGYYAWPANTTYITSPFGPRTHPIYGVLKPHTGVDIGASFGTAVTAAAAGTVSVAVLDYGTTGYGTYVAIYHDNGATTLYGHMSSLAVSAGQAVSQGQVIGYVGSTGAATGPHLHFEIRENGVCVDPMQYF